MVVICHCCHQQFAQTETLSNFCPPCAGRIFYVGSCEHLDDNPIYTAPSEEDK
jgi:Zn finger protein HypA/HybF involved in hydrogenase expression